MFQKVFTFPPNRTIYVYKFVTQKRDESGEVVGCGGAMGIKNDVSGFPFIQKKRFFFSNKRKVY